MKYVVFVGDGMSDEPMAELDGKTPLMVAHTPNPDRMAREGIGGWCPITPDASSPSRAAANRGALGYAVTPCYPTPHPCATAAVAAAPW